MTKILQISDHFTAHTPISIWKLILIKRVVNFKFNVWYDQHSSVSATKWWKTTGSHCICPTKKKKHNVQNVHVSVYTIQK